MRSLNSARDFTNISKRIASASFASETFVYAKQVFTGRSNKSALPELWPSKKGYQLIIKIFITLLLLMVGRNYSLLLILSLSSFPHQATALQNVVHLTKGEGNQPLNHLNHRGILS